MNRVTKRTYTNEPQGNQTPQVEYFYDGKGLTQNGTFTKGKLTKVTSAISSTEYTNFDGLGRISTHQQTTDGNTYTTSYVYNLSGALLEETYPSNRVVKNTLDTDGDLQQVQSRKANETFKNYANSFNYTAAGAVSSIRLGNGRWENTTFNNRLQPTQIGLGASATNQSLLKLNYDYGNTDNNGNIKSQTITVPTIGASQGFTAIQTYDYDSLNRLKSAVENIDGNQTPNWKQTFTYDRYGNRSFDEGSSGGNYLTTTLTRGCSTSGYNPNGICDKKKVNPIFAPTNRIAQNQDGTNDYLFDNGGNTTKDASGNTYIYDAENKQIEVKNSSNQTIGQYWYDGDGKRVKKYVPSTGETTIFIYDASGKMVAEYSTIIASSQDAIISYLTNDHLSSPRIITDQNGAVVSRRDFMPFGEEITRTNYGSDNVREKFATYERDTESNLDFAQARMFTKTLGRFTTADPIFIKKVRLLDPQRINLYIYARNQPLLYIDATGEDITIRITNVVVGYQKVRTWNPKTEKFETKYESYKSYRVIVTNESGTRRIFEVTRSSSKGERGDYKTDGEPPPGSYKGTTTKRSDPYNKGFRIELTSYGQEHGVLIAPDGTERTAIQMHRNGGTSLGCFLFPVEDRERLETTITKMQEQDKKNGFTTEIRVDVQPRNSTDGDGIGDIYDLDPNKANPNVPQADAAGDVDPFTTKKKQGIEIPYSNPPRHPIP